MDTDQVKTAETPSKPVEEPTTATSKPSTGEFTRREEALRNSSRRKAILEKYAKQREENEKKKELKEFKRQEKREREAARRDQLKASDRRAQRNLSSRIKDQEKDSEEQRKELE